MAIQVFTPAVEVWLIKLVQRKDGVAARYAAAQREVELTPYLGDHGAVVIGKSILEPAGSFSITFGDQTNPDIGDTVAAMVEPMDMVEIRAARQPHQFAGSRLPLIMRGFVSVVRRSESMGQDGSPQRTVTVQGQDSGKLWLINQFLPLPAILANEPMLTTFKLLAAAGMDDVSTRPVSDFMTALTDKVMNVRVQKLSAVANRQLAPFKVEATVKDGVVIAPMIAEYQGSYWNLVELVADRPWNEVWIEDREEGPVLRFRPVPFKDAISGQFIMPGAEDPGTIEMDVSQIVSMDMIRSDLRVANFFWVPPGSSSLESSGFNNIVSISTGQAIDQSYGNNLPDLFGLRKMEVVSRLLPSDLQSLPSMLPAGGERDKALAQYPQWNQLRIAQLKALNRDNSVLEDGALTVQGSEDLLPGRYLRVTRGSLVWEAYIERVQHAIMPLQTWTTTLAVQRGTGFLVRNKAPGAPAWMEGRSGPYSSPNRAAA